MTNLPDGDRRAPRELHFSFRVADMRMESWIDEQRATRRTFWINAREVRSEEDSFANFFLCEDAEFENAIVAMHEGLRVSASSNTWTGRLHLGAAAFGDLVGAFFSGRNHRIGLDVDFRGEPRADDRFSASIVGVSIEAPDFEGES
jgi:hypothetical protein